MVSRSSRTAVARRWLSMAAAGGVTVLLAACGSSSSDAGNTPAKPVSGVNADNVVAVSQKLVEQARDGFVFSKTFEFVAPKDIITEQTFQGPTPTKPPTGERTAYLISCIPAGGCPYLAKKTAKVLQRLGWKTKVLVADGSPASYQQSFDTAISNKPDAIVSVAVGSKFVTQQIARAKKEGIWLVDAYQSPRSGEGYDAYVDFKHTLQEELMAAAVLATAKKNVNAAGYRVTGFPDYDINGALEYLKLCDTCKTSSVTIPVTDELNATKLQQVISNQLRRNPAINWYLRVGSSLPMQPVLSAINQSGGSGGKIKLTAADAQPPSIELMKQGKIPFQSYTPLEWVAMATADATLRGITKDPVADAGGWGIGAGLLTAAEAKQIAPLDYTGLYKYALGKFDFSAEYEKAWGIELGDL